MTTSEYRGLPTKQRKALRAVFQRDTADPKDKVATFEEFLTPAFHHTVMNCVMVPWAGMWLGIELDGHTHS